MHVRCPHCHNPIEIVDADLLSDISCPECGSNFSLIGEETVGYAPGAASDASSKVRTIGHFELLENLGTGSFGSVWKARDTKLDRTVAVKIPRRGELEGSEAEMFVREARSAAQVNHPGVVSVHEVGREGDTLYIVSDFIAGGSLKERLSHRTFTPREAVELCIKAAEALHAAHEAGIVHRDLKPGNIMMDEAGEPHITDFGLAKRETGEITMTVDGQIMGTPAYMSPEQARGEAHQADRRSDVYSLGVILFELLTGEVPFRGSQRMMIAQIVEDQPPSPRKLQSRVPRDMETICLKCLEKDPAKRYATSGEVAEELQRHLRGEPIKARRIGRVAHAWRWCKRNPVVAGSIAVVAATLLGGTIVSSAFAVIANRQRERAEAGERQATEEKQKAEEERQVAQAVRDFLQTKLLSQADLQEQADALLQGGESSAAAKQDPTIRELLDRAAKQLEPESIESNFPKQLSLQAEILATVGNAYRGVGEYQRSIGFLERAAALHREKLGPNHPDTLRIVNDLAVAYLLVNKVDEAVRLFEEALKGKNAELGPDHPDTLLAMNNLGQAYQDAGKLELALQLHKEALKLQKAKLGPDHPNTLNSMSSLAGAYHRAGKLELALPLLEETLKLRKAKLGPEHPRTIMSMNNLASHYWVAGKLDLALPLFEEALKLQKTKLGPDHPNTISSTSHLASAYRAAGKLEQGLSLQEESLKLTKTKLGPDHPDTLASMNDLAGACRQAGKLDRTLSLYEEALNLRKAKFGPDHPDTLVSMNNLASAYREAGKGQAAAVLTGEVLARASKRLPEQRLELAVQLAPTGWLLLQAKDFPQAESMLRVCLAIREKAEPDAWPTHNTKSMLGGALLGQKKYAEAEPLLRAGYEGMKRQESNIPLGARVRVDEALGRLIQFARATSKLQEVTKWQTELDARKKPAR